MSQIATKLAMWRDNYIDIAIRRVNNMLHQDPNSSTGIRLSTTPPFSYLLYWQIAMGKGSADDYALKSEANVDPHHRPIEWEPLRQGCENADKMSYLKNLANTCYKTIAKKGENPLCITFGRLTWKAHKPGNMRTPSMMMEINTPVLLIPIKLNKQGVNYWLKPVDDEAMINPSLLLKYAADGNKDFPLPPCGQWLDEKFDIQEYFADLAERFGENNDDFQFDPDFVSLDLFNYEKLCMYRDVSRNMDDIVKNKIIRAMFGEIPGKAPITPLGLDRNDPKKCFSILDSNSSQHEVIERFRAGESFILEGPPGTGKTQTIVNMISEALMAQKKVLFVSNKMSALTTVKKKLQMPGVTIDRHCLLVQGEGEDKEISLTDVYGKLSAAYHASPCAFSRTNYEENVSKLVDYRKTLLQYNEEFFSENNSLKTSLYDIIGKMLLLGYNENTAPSSVISLDAVRELSKERLNELVAPMREIETLVCAILDRFGTVENDVWFGFREEELSYDSEVALKSAIAEIAQLKRSLDLLLDNIRQSDEKLAARVAELLFAHPISAILHLLQLDPEKDLGSLYLKNDSLEAEKKAVEQQLELLEQYREARKSFLAKTTGAINPEAASLKLSKEEYPLWESAPVVRLSKDLTRAKRVSPEYLGAHLSDKEPNPKLLSEISESIKALLEALQEANAIHDRLAAHFTEDLFQLDHKPLLQKFRTSWQKQLQEGEGEPWFYGMHIKKLKKLCRDALNTAFDMKSVYALLEDLDLYHNHLFSISATQERLKEYGILYVKGNEAILETLAEYLQEFIVEISEHQIAELFGDSLSFAEYLAQKIAALEEIVQLAKALGVKDPDVTLADLRVLAQDHAILLEQDRRIAGTEELAAIFPSLPKNVYTDWEAMLEMLKLIESVLRQMRDGNRSLNEDYALFIRTIKVLTQKGLCARVEALINKYRAFYEDTRRFDPEVMGTAHLDTPLSYNDLAVWLENVSNADILTQYISFKKKVKELEPVSRQFFDYYAAQGRREHPANVLGNRYEIALLYAYYAYLISKSKTLGKLSGNDGITTLQSVIEEFAEADGAAIEWNRKILHNTLVSSISHSLSPLENKHGYLSSIPSSRGFSVRRLFALRSESILELTPCLMMSVYSVSKLLDFKKYKFDVVIFDEASQIPEEDALTALMRTESQVVISGDPKQMPAFQYFKSNESANDILWDNEDADEEAPEICSSILDFIINLKNSSIGYAKLNMHYRSNHESLIKFSNEQVGS